MKLKVWGVYLLLLLGIVSLVSAPVSAIETLESGGLKFEFIGDSLTKIFDLEFKVGVFAPAIQSIRICCIETNKNGRVDTKNILTITTKGSLPPVTVEPYAKPFCRMLLRTDTKDFANGNIIKIRVELKNAAKIRHTVTFGVNGMRKVGKKKWSLLSLPAVRAAIVYDVGGRGDLSFNDMAYLGAISADVVFQAGIVEVPSATAADYLPNLRNVARTGEFDIIICVGFLLGDALATAAAEFPEQKFAIIDVGYITGPNIMNIVFRENEASALIGALAAMAAADAGFTATGVVLGIPIPVLYHFEAGYRFGQDWGLAKYAELTGNAVDVAMLYNYTGTFSDITLGKAASEAMLAQGAVGIYNVAGPVGIGNHAAVAEYHAAAGTNYGPPYYFGSDSCEDWRGDGMHALASGMKRVDVGTYTAVKAVANGMFVSGVTSLGLAEGGVGISRFEDMDDWLEFAVDASQIDDTQEARNLVVANWTANRQTVEQWIWDAIDELEAGILDGTFVVLTANSDDEINAIREQYPLN